MPHQSLKHQRGTAAVGRIFAELAKAEEKHPSWPGGLAWPLAIVGEEYGEACQAAIDHEYKGAPLERVRVELAQCGAMCLRALVHLEEEGDDSPGN